MQVLSNLHDAIEAKDEYRIEEIISQIKYNAKAMYLKGKFHAYRGPGKQLKFAVWLRIHPIDDPLGLNETPEDRRRKWDE